MAKVIALVLSVLITLATPAESAAADPVRSKNGPATSRSYAKTTMLARYGWNKVQYRCLDQIWTRESHWNHKAKNKNSSAYGIPQILGLKDKNPKVQVDKGLKYIKHRYGTPCKAWKFWQTHGWY